MQCVLYAEQNVLIVIIFIWSLSAPTLHSFYCHHVSHHTPGWQHVLGSGLLLVLCCSRFHHLVCDSVGSLAHTNRICDRRMTRNYTVITMQVFDLFSDQESVMLLLCCAKMCTVWNVWWKVSHFSCFVSHLRSQHGTHGPEQRWNILISKTFSTNCLEILSEHVCGGRWWGRGSRITWRDRVLQFWH